MDTETLKQIACEIDSARWDIQDFMETRLRRLALKIIELDRERISKMLDEVAEEQKAI